MTRDKEAECGNPTMQIVKTAKEVDGKPNARVRYLGKAHPLPFPDEPPVGQDEIEEFLR